MNAPEFPVQVQPLCGLPLLPEKRSARLAR